MDVTPELIETVDFPEKFRGYDPEEVNKFLEMVGGKIVELTDSLAAANRRADEERMRADEAMNAAAAARPAHVAMTEEEEAAEATKTLMLARRTADALIADARAEAHQALEAATSEAAGSSEAARAEADRLVEDARRTSESMVEDGRQRADSEFARRRDEINAELDSLLARKKNALADVEALEGRVAEYRTALETVSTQIGALLADPDLLRERSPLDIDESVPEVVVDTTGTEAHPAAPPVHTEPLPTRDPGAAGDSFTGDAFAAPTPTADARPQAETAPTGSIPFPPPPAPGAAPVTPAAPAAGTAGDPWVPGSWSAVIEPPAGEPAPASTPGSGGATFSATERFDAPAEDPSPFATDDRTQEPPAPDAAFQVVEMDAEPVTGSFGGLSQDRYLRDLDAAVNSDEPDEADDAMSAFLLGDDEAQARRFGRRR